MKAKVLLLLLIGPFIGLAQMEGNTWYFGNKAGVSFSSGAPVAIFNSAMNTGHGCASISDPCNGRILFYTDGSTVWDSTHNVMPNGTGLLGDRLSTQSAIIVPNPDTSKSEYYIFTVKQNGLGGINFSTVDMKLNGGRGDIVAANKNTPLVTPTVEKLTAVKHKNNEDLWVITHQLNTNAFYAYLVTTAGVNTTPVISNVGNVYDSDAIQGYLKASPDGQHLAAALRNKQTFEVFDFDFNTGIVSNSNTFPSNYPGAYGVEFSPDGSKLYTTVNSNGLYQFDLNAGSNQAIANSAVKLSGTPSVALQLGPDGKIYTNEGRWFGRIDNPNELGTASNYVSQVVYLGASVFGNSGLPTFLQSYFSPISFVEDGVCLGGPTDFSITNLTDIDSVKWDFDDPASGPSNSSKAVNASHTYSQSGKFFPKLIYFGNVCGNPVSDTSTREITILDVLAPTVELGADTTICPGQEIELNAAVPFSTYEWSDGSTDSTFIIKGEGTYWVEITNSCGIDQDTIEVTEFSSSLSLDLGNDTSFCNGNSITLDASQNNANYLWSDGSTNASNTIASRGKHWVTVSDECSELTDTINISILLPPAVVLHDDTTLCQGDTIILNAFNEESTYKWQDGSTEPLYLVNTEGFYEVSVFNKCGRGSAFTEIRYKDCSCYVYAPSAFTPNGDRLNNNFEVVYDCIFNHFTLSIFNRWGELVYYTNNPKASWDGNINGAEAPAGMYTYKIEYEAITNNDPLQKKQWGRLSIIR